MKGFRSAQCVLLGALALVPLRVLAAAKPSTTNAAPAVITIQYEPGYSDAKAWGATVSGSGVVHQWEQYVQWKNGVPRNLAKIRSQYSIEPSKVAVLLRLFEREHFRELADTYSANCTTLKQASRSVEFHITDQPTMKLALSLGQREKTVTVYGAGYIVHSAADSSAPAYPYLPEVTRFVRIFAGVVGVLQAPNAYQTQNYYLQWLSLDKPNASHRQTCIESSNNALQPTAQLLRSRSAAEFKR